MTAKNIAISQEMTAGHALRHEIFNKLTPILLGSDFITDSNARLLIQANCLDMVTALEDLISEFNLDQK